jgi:hypothetical protein
MLACDPTHAIALLERSREYLYAKAREYDRAAKG